MNNFNDTEKALKRWLKSRVKVNIATVVGFLIAGTVVFGAEYKQQDIANSSGVTTGNKAYAVIKPTDSENTVSETLELKDNDNLESAKWLISVEGKKLTVNENVTLKGTNLTGVTVNAWESDITNKGTIDGAANGWAAVTLVGQNNESKLNNEGTVNGVVGVDGVKRAINVEGKATLTNSGTINGNIYSDGSKDNEEIVINLKKGSKINGAILLGDEKSTINIDGVEKESLNIEANNIVLKINNSDITLDSNVTVEGKLKSEDSVIVMDNKVGNNTLINNATLEGVTGIEVNINDQDTSATAKTRLISITNKGNITASNFGIYNNGYFTNHSKVEIKNEGNILVNDFIRTTSGNTPYYYNNGIYQASAAYTEVPGKVTNTGKIEISLNEAQSKELKDKYTENPDMFLNIHGVRIHEHSEGYNEGDIIVNSFGGVGVALTGGGDKGAENFADRYGYFENIGNITVIGENVRGIKIKNATTFDSKEEAINKESGIITIEGTNSIGVELIGKNTHFINEGTIALGMNDTGNWAISNSEGTAKNIGYIKVTDMTKEEILEAVANIEEARAELFDGEVEDLGLILDKEDKAVFTDEENTVTGDTTTEILDKLANGESVGTDGDLTITGTGDDTVEAEVFNVTRGTASINGEVNIIADKINLDANGSFEVKDGSTLSFENGVFEKAGEGIAIEVAPEGILSLNNMTVTGDIQGSGFVNISGEGKLNGSISGTDSENKIKINFGSPVTTFALAREAAGRDQVELSTTGNFNNSEIAILSDAQVVLNVEADGTNMFGNSEGMDVTGTGEDDVLVKTGNLTGEKVTVGLGESNTFTNVGFTSDSTLYKVADSLTDENGLVLEYNTNLFEGSLSKLNEINNGASVVNELFSTDLATRASELDKFYSSNIYSETVRAAYDNVKLNEEAILTLGKNVEIGKWTAEGKALYSKDEYDRDGVLKDTSSEIESTGLMAGFNYGLNETARVGFAFSGVKQDVDTDTGSADADLFYLGVYGNKQLGNYDLTAGLGYQFGEYEAKNHILGNEKDKYDTKALRGFVQGRYTANFADGVSVQPRVKLGYTYIDQDNAKDTYFGVSDAEISTFDAELGLDAVKTINLEKSRVDLKLGASYVRTMGDTDEEFKGRFYNDGVAGQEFSVLGAELAENVVKFNLGAEVSHENGFFYNGGVTYEFGSDDTEAYGVNVGVGYKF